MLVLGNEGGYPHYMQDYHAQGPKIRFDSEYSANILLKLIFLFSLHLCLAKKLIWIF